MFDILEKNEMCRALCNELNEASKITDPHARAFRVHMLMIVIFQEYSHDNLYSEHYNILKNKCSILMDATQKEMYTLSGMNNLYNGGDLE